MRYADIEVSFILLYDRAPQRYTPLRLCLCHATNAIWYSLLLTIIRLFATRTLFIFTFVDVSLCHVLCVCVICYSLLCWGYATYATFYIRSGVTMALAMHFMLIIISEDYFHYYSTPTLLPIDCSLLFQYDIYYIVFAILLITYVVICCLPLRYLLRDCCYSLPLFSYRHTSFEIEEGFDAVVMILRSHYIVLPSCYWYVDYFRSGYGHISLA